MMRVEKYDFMIPNQGTDKKTKDSSVTNPETIQRYENCDLNMNNYTFDPTLSCNDDEIEDVWCVSFGDIMSQLGGGNFSILHDMDHIIWTISYGPYHMDHMIWPILLGQKS